jgi:hypothetical protein
MNPTEINWRSVDSSNIDAIALHDDHLCVRFTSGAVYRYQAAEGGELDTTALYEKLAQADENPDLSVGSVFHAIVRGKVPGEKVEPD